VAIDIQTMGTWTLLSRRMVPHRYRLSLINNTSAVVVASTAVIVGSFALFWRSTSPTSARTRPTSFHSSSDDGNANTTTTATNQQSSRKPVDDDDDNGGSSDDSIIFPKDCPMCAAMMAGPCAAQFRTWYACTKTQGDDHVARCKDQFEALLVCLEENDSDTEE